MKVRQKLGSLISGPTCISNHEASVNA